MSFPIVPRVRRHLALWSVLALLFVSGCATVRVAQVSDADYLAQRRADVLTGGHPSASTRATLQIVGLDESRCFDRLPACRDLLLASTGLDDERRLSALAELWLREAQRTDRRDAAVARINAYLDTARYAYAYLFFTERKPGVRALEDRQTQVRDYYNVAVRQAMAAMFDYYRGRPPAPEDEHGTFSLEVGRWQVVGRLEAVRLAQGRALPKSLIPAPSLAFAGLRNQYRRDGIGGELVAATSHSVVSSREDTRAWREMPFPAITAVLRFPGDSLAEVLATRQVQVHGYDPYRQDTVDVAGSRVPLAADFTAAYGLWLARSGFARQALLTLLGKGDVLESPHVYLLQPYDPNRRIVIMLHGLASSPEAWINVANEVLGDEVLRRNYQIWQVYYPTNLPLPLNNVAIREAITKTLAHFDPAGTSVASRDIVMVGHSMGGVLARLMLSSSGDQVWDGIMGRFDIHGSRLRKARQELDPLLRFEPLPQVTRAIFIAAPHRGTPYAERRVARWISGMVRLPVSVLGRFKELTQLLVDPHGAAPAALDRSLTSIDNLSNQSPFVQAAADLPISPRVRYHSIMGNDTPTVALALSSDGVVPYSSAHLEGAASEKVVPSWHSVQETPEAILEIRRILHEHIAAGS